MLGSSGQVQILGNADLVICGGQDIDAQIARYLLENTPGAQDAAPPDASSTAADLRRRIELRLVAEHLKVALSNVSIVESYLGSGDITIRLTRSELETLAEPVIARTVACCRNLLASLDVSPGALAGILLVGGGSNMPLVPATLNREFGAPARRNTNRPELTVVVGAARFAQQAGSWPSSSSN
jgi:molecular chaperone DnaK